MSAWSRFIVLRAIFAVVLSKPGLEHIAALWEPFGIGAFGLATRYWTASERNTLVPPIEGYLLWNRLIWLGVAWASWRWPTGSFRFETGQASRAQRKARRSWRPRPPRPPAAGRRPARCPSRVFDAATACAQLWARTRLDMGQVFKSPAYFVLLAPGGPALGGQPVARHRRQHLRRAHLSGHPGDDQRAGGVFSFMP